MYENPSNANNVWASLRTFDAYGIQYIDIIMQVSYHAGQFTQWYYMILNTNYMIQNLLVTAYPDTLLDWLFLNHVIIRLHHYDSYSFYVSGAYELLFIFYFSFSIVYSSYSETFHSSWRKEVMTSAMGTQKWLTLKEQVIDASNLPCLVPCCLILDWLFLYLDYAHFTIQ